MAKNGEVVFALHLDPLDPYQREFIDLMSKISRKKAALAGIIAHEFLSIYNLVSDEYDEDDIKNFISNYSIIAKLRMSQSPVVAGTNATAPVPVDRPKVKKTKPSESRSARRKEKKPETAVEEAMAAKPVSEVKEVEKIPETTEAMMIDDMEESSIDDPMMQAAMKGLSAFGI